MTTRVRTALGRDSLVRRLVVLAAAWSLAVLVAAGLALAAFFSQAETSSFNSALSGAIDELTAGASVDKGQVVGPVDTDPRTQRAYSGSYWEIATAEPAGPSQMVRSRSLWDRALPLPPGGLETDVRDVLWNVRRLDLVGQILIILAGVFGVVILFKDPSDTKGGTNS